jgi:hypothetical protein
MNRRADWLAWSLQAIVGLLVGGLFGFHFSDPGHRLFAIRHVSVFVWGVALFGAALASYYGDCLWFAFLWLREREFSLEHPRRSSASRIASALVGLIGLALVLAAIG